MILRLRNTCNQNVPNLSLLHWRVSLSSEMLNMLIYSFVHWWFSCLWCDNASLLSVMMYGWSTVVSGLLWRAPELLRDPNSLPRGSQKGDVYSFAFIVFEIHTRCGPWGDTSLAPKGTSSTYIVVLRFSFFLYTVVPGKKMVVNVNYFGKSLPR